MLAAFVTMRRSECRGRWRKVVPTVYFSLVGDVQKFGSWEYKRAVGAVAVT